MEFRSGVYKITNKINGKCYIGMSTNIERRWKEHKHDYLRPKCKSYNSALYNAFRKYGVDNFEFSVLGEYPEEELREREIEWVSFYDSKVNGYNMTYGGDGIFTVDHDKIKELWDKGYSCAEIAHEMNCGATTVTRTLQTHPNYSESESRFRGNERNKIPIVQYSLSGEKIAEYDGISDAAKAVDCDAVLLTKGLENGRYHSVKGFQWRRKSYVGDSAKILPCPGYTGGIRQYTLEAQFICEYESVQAASEATGIDRSYITSACTKKKSSGGYLWTHTIDPPPEKHSSTKRNISQYGLDGSFIKTYKTMTEAAKALSIDVSSLCAACKKKKKTAGGYQWRYAADLPPNNLICTTKEVDGIAS